MFSKIYKPTAILICKRARHHIHICIKASAEFEAFAVKYQDMIMGDTLADTLTVSKVDGFTKENDINGDIVTISLKKVEK